MWWPCRACDDLCFGDVELANMHRKPFHNEVDVVVNLWGFENFAHYPLHVTAIERVVQEENDRYVPTFDKEVAIDAVKTVVSEVNVGNTVLVHDRTGRSSIVIAAAACIWLEEDTDELCDKLEELEDSFSSSPYDRLRRSISSWVRENKDKPIDELLQASTE